MKTPFDTTELEKEIMNNKRLIDSWCKKCDSSSCGIELFDEHLKKGYVKVSNKSYEELKEESVKMKAILKENQRLRKEVEEIIDKCKKYYNHDMTQIELKELKSRLGLK